MSTLGDLLAEHTVLPGNAVDHLHAVVGEWQLLADLSFADYLMWVRRDDGMRLSRQTLGFCDEALQRAPDRRALQLHATGKPVP